MISRNIKLWTLAILLFNVSSTQGEQGASLCNRILFNKANYTDVGHFNNRVKGYCLSQLNNELKGQN